MTAISDNQKYFVTADALINPSEPRERFRKHFDEAKIEDHGKQWDKLWEEGEFLPWDKLCASPALEDLLAEQKDKLFKDQPRRRALVGGCGRGYDVHLFAQFGYDAVGVEISENAVKEAKKWIASQLKEAKEDSTVDETKLGHIDVLYGDFFSNDWLNELKIETTGGFDLAYDYAFLVAMNPSLREKWAARMAELIAPKTGYLICLEYPLFRPLDSGGPPHPIRSENYDQLLGEKFERVLRYMPERTHKVGEGSDLISVWRRKET